MNIKQIIEEAYIEAIQEAGAFYGGFPPNHHATPRPNLSERIAIEDADQAVIDLVTKKYGKTHEQDFFSDDYSSYFKFIGPNRRTIYCVELILSVISFCNSSVMICLHDYQA